MTQRAFIVWLVLFSAATTSLVFGATWAWGQYIAAGGRPIVFGALSPRNNDALADAMLKLHPEYRSMSATNFELVLQAALLTSVQGQLCAGLWPEFQPSAQILRHVADATFAVGDRLKLTTPAQHQTAEQLPQYMQNQLDHGLIKGAGTSDYTLCALTDQAVKNSPEARLADL